MAIGWMSGHKDQEERNERKDKMNIQGFSPTMSAPMQAQATTSTGAASGSSGSSSSSSSTNGLSSTDLQSTFLNLLVTELQNQDPTQPVDPTEMVSQMVSLNQLDQLISINQTLTNMSGSSTSGTSGSTPTPNAAASALATNPSAAGAIPGSSSPGAAAQFLPAYNGSTPGGLMNLYGNIGAPVPTSNLSTPKLSTPGGR